MLKVMLWTLRLKVMLWTLRLKVVLWALRLKVETWDRYWMGLVTASAEAPHCQGYPRTLSDESSL